MPDASVLMWVVRCLSARAPTLTPETLRSLLRDRARSSQRCWSRFRARECHHLPLQGRRYLIELRRLLNVGAPDLADGSAHPMLALRFLNKCEKVSTAIRLIKSSPTHPKRSPALLDHAHPRPSRPPAPLLLVCAAFHLLSGLRWRPRHPRSAAAHARIVPFRAQGYLLGPPSQLVSSAKNDRKGASAETSFTRLHT